MSVIARYTAEPDELTLISQLGLSAREAQLFKLILEDADEYPVRTVRQYIHNIRRKLQRFHIVIVGIGNGRYAVPPHAREKLKDAMNYDF